MDWRHRASCRDEDPELFYPVGVSGPALLQIAEAKSVCRRCPIMSACLAYALDNNIEWGVWGGLSEQERAALKRRQARTRQRATAKPPPAKEITPREPARVNGLLVAAPGTVEDRLYQERTPGQRLHVVMADGRSACGAGRLDAGRLLPAAALRGLFRCRAKACKAVFTVADQESLAVPHG